MASLVKSGKYRAISKTETEKYGFYVIMFTSEASRHPLCLNNCDYDYILEEIDCQYKF